MIKLAVIHFMPLEYYPPVTNFLNYIGEKEGVQTKAWTCYNIKNRRPYFSKKLNIIRVPFPNVKEAALIRFMKYWVFNLKTLIGLLYWKPDKVLYYESYSVWPVYIYLKFFNKRSDLFIHYHEYSTPDWYREGMRLVRQYHKLEKNYLFHKASWISQTNKNRLDLFQKDYVGLNEEKLHILANYPPKNWQTNINANKGRKDLAKFVYVGSLSLNDTYIAEICTWIKELEGKASLDVFSYNLDYETLMYLNSLKSKWIKFHSNGVEYYDLPSILYDFDVGLILYKANTVNYKFNETNKLFEYLACSLDVWFPDVMEGTTSHICKDAIPRVLNINFENLNQYNIIKHLFTTNLPVRKSNYNCESENEKIYKKLRSEG